MPFVRNFSHELYHQKKKSHNIFSRIFISNLYLNICNKIFTGQSQFDCLASLGFLPCVLMCPSECSPSMVGPSLMINIQTGSRRSSITCKASHVLFSISVDHGRSSRYQFCLREHIQTEMSAWSGSVNWLSFVSCLIYLLGKCRSPAEVSFWPASVHSL